MVGSKTELTTSVKLLTKLTLSVYFEQINYSDGIVDVQVYTW